jgi:hypothetical protein
LAKRREKVPATNIPREKPDAIAFQGATDAGTGGLKAMITLEAPNDSLMSEVEIAPQVKDPLYLSGGDLPRVIFGNGFLAKKSCFAFLFIG